jgi:hypothetical protein
MYDKTIITVTAIAGLVVLEAINLLTARIDGAILVTISSIIAGIAGYEFKGWQLGRRTRRG